MSTKNLNNAGLILEMLKSAYNLRTDSKLADFLGVSPGTVSSWKTRDSIDYKLIFEKCSDLDMNSLLYGDEAMRYADGQYSVNEASVEYDAEFSSIPFYAGVKASAGMGLVAQEDKPALEIKLRSYYINNTLRTQASNLFGIIAQGDSMIPDLENRDMVIIDQGKRAVKEGRIYAVRIDEEVYLKKISPRPGGIYILRSSNPAYPEFEVKKEDPNFEVLGMAVNLSRTLI